MHICVLPIETLLNIFTTTTHDSDDSIDNPLPTLAVLARTCRRFKEPALNVLWKNVRGFEPLILCLPKGVWRRKSATKPGASRAQLTLTRPLFAGEWKIFNSYACRIRCLTINQQDLDEIGVRVMTVFVSAPSSVLVPNLHTLIWYDKRDTFLPLLNVLLAPTIRSLTVCSSPGKPWEPSFAKSALLASLGTRCPQIQEFTCPCNSDPAEKSGALWEAISCWSGLSRLNAGVLGIRALTHLASLPLLRSLYFVAHNFVTEDPPKSIPTFSTVDSVTITASSLPILQQCLRNLRFVSCLSIALHVDRSEFAMPYDLYVAVFIDSLSQCFSPTLEQFTIKFADLNSTNDFVIGFTTFHTALGNCSAVSSLLPFSRLKVVDLNWICASVIDDAMIQTMAQSWPQLEEIHLGTGACWSVPPSLTFTGLVYLLKYCRRLHSIAIVFRACSIDNRSESFSKTTPNEKITTLSVGNSPIDTPLAVVCQLYTLLPNLDTVSYFRHESESDSSPFERRWARVAAFLEALVKATKMRQEQAQALGECPLLI